MLKFVPPFGITEGAYAENIRAIENELERVGGTDARTVSVDRGILLGLLEERLSVVTAAWELWQGSPWTSRPIEIKATEIDGSETAA